MLRDAGHEVIALVRTPAKAADLRARGVQVVAGDITDKESMRAPMTGVDGVFHIAATYTMGGRHGDRLQRSNVDGTRNVLELMRDLQIPKGVYTSSVAIWGDVGDRRVDETFDESGAHISEYYRTKRVAHCEVALPMIRSGLPLVVLQPGQIYGPGDTSIFYSSIATYLRGLQPMIPSSTIAAVYVDDVARVHLVAMECGRIGESYLVAGADVPVKQMIRYVTEISGVKRPYLTLPRKLLSATSQFFDVLDKLLPLPEQYTGEGLRAITMNYRFDCSKARRELDFNPRPLEEGLVPTVEDVMARIGMKPRLQ